MMLIKYIPRYKMAMAAELDAILSELKEKDLAELPPDKILELRKKVNPYGRTIEGSDNYLNFSITQISHEYWKKFITTSMVAFLNRMCDEWKVPEGVPVIPVYEYLEDKTKLETPKLIIDRKVEKSIKEWEFNRKWMEKRIIVKEFLEEFLQFNPDEHVRSAYRPNRGDKTRDPVDTPAGDLAVKHLSASDKEFAAKENLYNEVMKMKDDKKTDEVKTSDKKTDEVKTSDKKTDEVKKESKVKVVIDKDGRKKLVRTHAPDKIKGVDPTVAETTREMIPPHDIFGRFKLYYTSNYEQLRDAVKDLYCEKPDLELAINPYSWHDSADKAEDFKKKHRNEVIAEVFTAHSGKWNFFDTFKEQRDNVNFYNDSTIVLEEIMKQNERDGKLAKDMMAKAVKKKKKVNELLDGPDAESFKKWRQQNSEINKLGASYLGGQASDDCPTDAVQVDVWKVAKGGMEIAKEHFFTQAETPDFVDQQIDRATGKFVDVPYKPVDKTNERKIDKSIPEEPFEEKKENC
jgi:hypothetical protein